MAFKKEVGSGVTFFTWPTVLAKTFLELAAKSEGIRVAERKRKAGIPALPEQGLDLPYPPRDAGIDNL